METETKEFKLKEIIKDLERKMKTGFSILNGLYELNILSWDDLCEVYDEVIRPESFKQIWMDKTPRIEGYKMCEQSNQLYISSDYREDVTVLPLENLDYCYRYLELVQMDHIDIETTGELIVKDIEKHITELMGLVKEG